MKKLFLLFLAIIVVPCYFSFSLCSENSKSDNQEIILDFYNIKKDYNLKKTDYRNNPKYDNNDDDDVMNMPVNFTPIPLQLLRQYQDNI